MTLMTDLTVTAGDVSERLLIQASERRKDPKTIWGIPSGFRGLDKLTGGIQNEEMTILMARPGVGKSSFLGQLVLRVAAYQQFIKSDKVARMVLCEMSAESFQQRLICAAAGIPLRRVREGRMNDEQFHRYMEAADTIGGLPIEYLDSPRSLEHSADWISGREKGAKQCAWFGVDYLQIHPVRVGSDASNTFGNATAISTAFRKLAREVAPGMVLSQMSRRCEQREDKRPQLSDLRDSGAIEQDASLVLGLYREDIYQQIADHERNEPKSASLLVLKQRNGPLGTIRMVWVPTAMRYEDAETEDKYTE